MRRRIHQGVVDRSQALTTAERVTVPHLPQLADRQAGELRQRRTDTRQRVHLATRGLAHTVVERDEVVSEDRRRAGGHCARRPWVGSEA